MFVRIRTGWAGAGRIGLVLGDMRLIKAYPSESGQYWTPVLWEDEEAPTFHKSIGLELFGYSVEKSTRAVAQACASFTYFG